MMGLFECVIYGDENSLAFSQTYLHSSVIRVYIFGLIKINVLILFGEVLISNRLARPSLSEIHLSHMLQ